MSVTQGKSQAGLSLFSYLSQLLLSSKDQRMQNKFDRILRKFYLGKENFMEPHLSSIISMALVAWGRGKGMGSVVGQFEPQL